MKSRKIFYLSALLLVLGLSFTSCKRSGYGCPMEMKISIPVKSILK